jgi:carbohydrate binding protein with CBM4/9 domain
MNRRRPGDFSSPESIASALVGLLAVGVIAAQALAGMSVLTTPTASPGPSAAPSPAPTMDPEIRRALATALLVNQSLASRGAALESALAVEPPLAADIAEHLRSVNADLTAGKEAADRLRLGDATADLGADLTAFYDGLLVQTTATLGNSFRNTDAYVEGARAVIDLLAPLPALNDRITDALVGRSGVTPSPSGSAVTTPPPTSPSPPTHPPATPSLPPPSFSPSAQPSGPPASLVFNPGFEDGVNGWQLQLTDGAQATLAPEPLGGPDGSAAARVDITMGSPARSGIALMSDVFVLSRGETYSVDLWVKSTAAREVSVRLVATGGQVTASRVLQAGTTWSEISFDVTHLAADPNVQLSLDLGRSNATVWFDNIVVRKSAG